MAFAGKDATLKSLCECPICFEPYLDPRLLECGHQFCEHCLIDISKRHKDGHFPCPICRVVTIPQDDDVSNLPRSTLQQYMQHAIFNQPKEMLGKLCTKCKLEKPTRHCPECKAELAYMCDNCFVKRQKVPRLAKHETVLFDPLYVCTIHQNKMVECFCIQCKKVICEECIFVSHGDHPTEIIDDAAKRGHEKLLETLTKIEEEETEQGCLYATTGYIEELARAKSTLEEKQRLIKETWTTFELKLDTYIQTKKSEIEATAETLKQNRETLEAALTNTNTTKTFIQKLIEEASKPQLALSDVPLPDTDTDIDDISLSVPDVSDELDKLGLAISSFDIESIAEDISAEIEIEVGQQRLQLSTEFQNSTKQPLLLKLYDDEYIIRHNKNGTKKRKLCSYFHDGDLCQDFDIQFRDLVKAEYDGTYVAACLDYQSHLRLAVDGEECTIKIEEHFTNVVIEESSVIVYGHDGDEELSSDESDDGSEKNDTDSEKGSSESIDTIASTNESEGDPVKELDEDLSDSTILVLSHETKTIICKIKKEHVSRPKFVACGRIFIKKRLAVTDDTNEVKLFDLDGTLVFTYGPELKRFGTMDTPAGVAIDQSGRVYVCDSGNKRVLRFTGVNSEFRTECVLDPDVIGGTPWSIAVDTDMRIHVSVANCIKIYECVDTKDIDIKAENKLLVFEGL